MRPILLISILAWGGTSLCQADVTIGSAVNYGILGMSTSTMVNNMGTVNGTVGISANGPYLSFNGKTVNGNVVNMNSGWFSNRGTIGGSMSTDAAGLYQSATDAQNAFNTALTLAPTQSLARINTPSTINGADGLNVISVAGNITNSLNLNGSSNSFFVVLVGGTLALGANESLGVSGGLTANHVLYVFDGPNGTVTTSANDTVNGTLLAPAYNFTLNGTFNGAIIGGGQNITVMNAVINSNPYGSLLPAVPATDPTGVPEPMTFLITGLGLIAVVGFARFSAKRTR